MHITLTGSGLALVLGGIRKYQVTVYCRRQYCGITISQYNTYYTNKKYQIVRFLANLLGWSWDEVSNLSTEDNWYWSQMCYYFCALSVCIDLLRLLQIVDNFSTTMVSQYWKNWTVLIMTPWYHGIVCILLPSVWGYSSGMTAFYVTMIDMCCMRLVSQ